MFLELNADINILQRSWKVDCDGTFDKDISRKNSFGALWAENFFCQQETSMEIFAWEVEIGVSIKIFNA